MYIFIQQLEHPQTAVQLNSPHAHHQKLDLRRVWYGRPQFSAGRERHELPSSSCTCSATHASRLIGGAAQSVVLEYDNQGEARLQAACIAAHEASSVCVLCPCQVQSNSCPSSRARIHQGPAAGRQEAPRSCRQRQRLGRARRCCSEAAAAADRAQALMGTAVPPSRRRRRLGRARRDCPRPQPPSIGPTLGELMVGGGRALRRVASRRIACEPGAPHRSACDPTRCIASPASRASRERRIALPASRAHSRCRDLGRAHRAAGHVPIGITLSPSCCLSPRRPSP
jgi:hypothetical protein